MRTLFICSVLISSYTLFAQNPVWDWAKEGTTTNGASGQSVSGNGNGKCVVGGSFSDTTIQFGTFNLFNGGNFLTDDIFLTKYDANGNVIWAYRFGGVSNDAILDVFVDRAENIFVTGHYSSPSLILGSFTLNNSSGNSDVFTAKFNASGTCIWARAGNGNGFSEGRSISVDTNGYCYVGGVFGGNGIQFGTLNLTNTNAATTDLFLIQYTGAGNETWCWNAISSGDDALEEIASAAASYIAITGSFNGATIGIDTYTLNNVGGYDAFVAVVDGSTGSVYGTLGIGTTNDEYGRSIAVGNQIGIITGGDFSGPSLTIGSYTVNNPNNGSNQCYLAHIDWSMFVYWARSFGGTGSDVSGAIHVDPFDKIYTTGSYESQNIIFNQDTLSATGGSDVYVCRWASNGNPLWAISGGGLGYDYGLDVYGDSLDEVRVTGIFSGFNVPFGPNILNTVTNSVFTGAIRMQSCIAPEPPICMVTADSLSQFNIIMWDKTSYTTVDSFIVFREITTNNYQRIGAQPYAALSQFIDTTATLYFPNTGNPNAGTYRYKLQTHDTCGAYSALGPYHNTIFMSNNNGTFSWPQLYTIENSPNPVNAYVLLRDDNNTGNWQAINSVAGTQQSVTDPAYNAWVATANWRIRTLWSISCNPTMRTDQFFSSIQSSSYSNTKLSTFGISPLDISSSILLYPNPSSTLAWIELPDTGPVTLEILCQDGRRIRSESIQGPTYQLDIHRLSGGVYHVRIFNEKVNAVKRLVVR